MKDKKRIAAASVTAVFILFCIMANHILLVMKL